MSISESKFLFTAMLNLTCLIPLSACSNAYDENLAQYKDMPNDAQVLIKKQIDCNHWWAEEFKRSQPKVEIDEAISALHCDDLDFETDRLFSQYKSQPKILDAINHASDHIFYSPVWHP